MKMDIKNMQANNLSNTVDKYINLNVDRHFYDTHKTLAGGDNCSSSQHDQHLTENLKQALIFQTDGSIESTNFSHQTLNRAEDDVQNRQDNDNIPSVCVPSVFHEYVPTRKVPQLKHYLKRRKHLMISFSREGYVDRLQGWHPSTTFKYSAMIPFMELLLKPNHLSPKQLRQALTSYSFFMSDNFHPAKYLSDSIHALLLASNHIGGPRAAYIVYRLLRTRPDLTLKTCLILEGLILDEDRENFTKRMEITSAATPLPAAAKDLDNSCLPQPTIRPLSAQQLLFYYELYFSGIPISPSTLQLVSKQNSEAHQLYCLYRGHLLDPHLMPPQLGRQLVVLLQEQVQKQWSRWILKRDRLIEAGINIQKVYLRLRQARGGSRQQISQTVMPNETRAFQQANIAHSQSTQLVENCEQTSLKVSYCKEYSEYKSQLHKLVDILWLQQCQLLPSSGYGQVKHRTLPIEASRVLSIAMVNLAGKQKQCQTPICNHICLNGLFDSNGWVSSQGYSQSTRQNSRGRRQNSKGYEHNGCQLNHNYTNHPYCLAQPQPYQYLIAQCQHYSNQTCLKYSFDAQGIGMIEGSNSNSSSRSQDKLGSYQLPNNTPITALVELLYRGQTNRHHSECLSVGSGNSLSISPTLLSVGWHMRHKQMAQIERFMIEVIRMATEHGDNYYGVLRVLLVMGPTITHRLEDIYLKLLKDSLLSVHCGGTAINPFSQSKLPTPHLLTYPFPYSQCTPHHPLVSCLPLFLAGCQMVKYGLIKAHSIASIVVLAVLTTVQHGQTYNAYNANKFNWWIAYKHYSQLNYTNNYNMIPLTSTNSLTQTPPLPLASLFQSLPTNYYSSALVMTIHLIEGLGRVAYRSSLDNYHSIEKCLYILQAQLNLRNIINLNQMNKELIGQLASIWNHLRQHTNSNNDMDNNQLETIRDDGLRKKNTAKKKIRNSYKSREESAINNTQNDVNAKLQELISASYGSHTGPQLVQLESQLLKSLQNSAEGRQTVLSYVQWKVERTKYTHIGLIMKKLAPILIQYKLNIIEQPEGQQIKGSQGSKEQQMPTIHNMNLSLNSNNCNNEQTQSNILQPSDTNHSHKALSIQQQLSEHQSTIRSQAQSSEFINNQQPQSLIIDSKDTQKNRNIQQSHQTKAATSNQLHFKNLSSLCEFVGVRIHHNLLANQCQLCILWFHFLSSCCNINLISQNQLLQIIQDLLLKHYPSNNSSALLMGLSKVIVHVGGIGPDKGETFMKLLKSLLQANPPPNDPTLQHELDDMLEIHQQSLGLGGFVGSCLNIDKQSLDDGYQEETKELQNQDGQEKQLSDEENNGSQDAQGQTSNVQNLQYTLKNTHQSLAKQQVIKHRQPYNKDDHKLIINKPNPRRKRNHKNKRQLKNNQITNKNNQITNKHNQITNKPKVYVEKGKQVSTNKNTNIKGQYRLKKDSQLHNQSLVGNNIPIGTFKTFDTLGNLTLPYGDPNTYFYSMDQYGNSYNGTQPYYYEQPMYYDYGSYMANNSYYVDNTMMHHISHQSASNHQIPNTFNSTANNHADIQNNTHFNHNAYAYSQYRNGQYNNNQYNNSQYNNIQYNNSQNPISQYNANISMPYYYYQNNNYLQMKVSKTIQDVHTDNNLYYNGPSYPNQSPQEPYTVQQPPSLTKKLRQPISSNQQHLKYNQQPYKQMSFQQQQSSLLYTPISQELQAYCHATNKPNVEQQHNVNADAKGKKKKYNNNTNNSHHSKISHNSQQSNIIVPQRILMRKKNNDKNS